MLGALSLAMPDRCETPPRRPPDRSPPPRRHSSPWTGSWRAAPSTSSAALSASPLQAQFASSIAWRTRVSVRRRPGADARSLSIVLTAAGRRRAARVRRARETALASLLDDLSAAERRDLEQLTEHLLRSVTAKRLADRAAGVVPPGGWLCRLCDLESCGRQQGRCPAASTADAGALPHEPRWPCRLRAAGVAVAATSASGPRLPHLAPT